MSQGAECRHDVHQVAVIMVIKSKNDLVNRNNCVIYGKQVDALLIVVTEPICMPSRRCLG